MTFHVLSRSMLLIPCIYIPPRSPAPCTLLPFFNPYRNGFKPLFKVAQHVWVTCGFRQMAFVSDKTRYILLTHGWTELRCRRCCCWTRPAFPRLSYLYLHTVRSIQRGRQKASFYAHVNDSTARANRLFLINGKLKVGKNSLPSCRFLFNNTPIAFFFFLFYLPVLSTFFFFFFFFSRISFFFAVFKVHRPICKHLWPI